MLNKRSFISSLILGLMFSSVSVFASNLTERNVYGLLSENFTGAMQECGYSIDNIMFLTWSEWSPENNAPKSELKTDTTAKEGKSYLRVTALSKTSAGSWSGCGYGFIDSSKQDNPQSINHFKYLDFWIRKVEGNLSQLKVGVKDTANKVVSLSGKVDNSSTQWQHVVIDITSLGANLQNTLIPFLVICDDLTAKTVFDLDNIVLRTDSSAANFNIILKKVEDMQGVPDNPTQITWLDSVFHNSWQAAGQYVEINADKYSYAWTVRIWLNNGSATRNGMWAQGTDKEYVIPMACRVYNGKLYNFIESPIGDASYLIGQSAASHHNLYDRGVNPNSDPGYYPWLWLKEYREIDFTKQEDVDSITIWDSARGYHAAYPFDWTSGGQSGHSDGFVDFTGVDKTLRIYFGGDFNSAAGGITYTANVVIDLNYE